MLKVRCSNWPVCKGEWLQLHRPTRPCYCSKKCEVINTTLAQLTEVEAGKLLRLRSSKLASERRRKRGLTGKVGRPKLKQHKWASEAERLKAYRLRKQEDEGSEA